MAGGQGEGRLPAEDGRRWRPITVFRDTPDAASLTFKNFEPAARPDIRPRPIPFNQELDYRLRQAFVRLTVDGQSDEFWAHASQTTPRNCSACTGSRTTSCTNSSNGTNARGGSTTRSRARGGRLCLALKHNPSSRFHRPAQQGRRKLDPGSSQASFYASEIDLLPNLTKDELAAAGTSGSPPSFQNLLVTLNAPLDFTDPRSGKSFRMFQTSMSQETYPPQEFGIKLGEPVYVSGLSLNDDPGRGLTYVGCLLIVAGIFAAYFIKLVVLKQNNTTT